jgi:hypothetical protein
MSDRESYCLLLDANIWVAERLLQSSMGSAALYTIMGANSCIGLPEVVEREVNAVLKALAEKAVNSIGKESRLLSHLSGHRLHYMAPTALAISEGIEARWKELGGATKKVAFTFDHANSALDRIINKTSPTGENNEQFRDCCIWEVALELAAGGTVHLVSNDQGFYESRDRSRGMAASLRQEALARNADIRLHTSLRECLGVIESPDSRLDEAAIADSIVEAITPQARERLASRSYFELGRLVRKKIRGYATPRPSLIAVSFEVLFEMITLVQDQDNEQREIGSFTLGGVCSYDPILKVVSDIEVLETSESVERPGQPYYGSFTMQPSERSQFSPERSRIVP